MSLTTIKTGWQDLFGLGKFKIYILAVTCEGVAIRVENGGKKPKDYFLEGTGKGVRLAGDVSLKLLGLSEQRLAEIEINHPDNTAPRALKAKQGSLVLSRRKGDQVIIDKGKACVTVMAFDNRRCTLHIAYAGRSFETFLVIGENPVSIIPNIRVEYFGTWGETMSKLKFTAPRHVVIDRHEVHIRKEFDVSTIEEKRASYNVKRQDSTRIKTA